MELQGKKILIVGLGKTGIAAARFAAGRGAAVTVTDEKPEADLREALGALEGLALRVLTGGTDAAVVAGRDLVVPSPGVPPFNPLIREAERRGIPVVSEIELAFRFLRVPVIAITGTNGKTTVTALVGHILAKAGKRAFVGGNIGTPLAGYVGGPQDDDWAVLELSSFQLQRIETFRARAAVLLNTAPDHLDYHADYEEYRRAKERIFENQQPGDLAVLNADEPGSAELAQRLKARVAFFSSTGVPDEGMGLRGAELVCRTGGREVESYPLSMIRIPGRHNAENVMAAVMAARYAGCPPGAIAGAVESFRGLAHRIEFAGEKGGVAFYDDSKGTNVSAVLRALEAFEQPVILLLGGRDKNGDFRALGPTIRRRVKEMVLFGEARASIGDQIGGLVKTQTAATMSDAVHAAYADAAPGDVVLLSPGCASFDEFRSYAHRGEVFKETVNRLEDRTTAARRN
ncbi:MAG: UDP-N-acetylmuramoylalanine--D-glutamate ligase [Syntrophaceae bacterium PtaB.Bin038]|nr:MAG: UDP-N-acetylmuramoylalanine--D-glutamate ligase [Syntrophaceae bacterium PtaB.Bin038]